MTGDRPGVFLQWKGTDACLDFYCTCGEQFHFDGFFGIQLTCGACGQTWELPHMLVPEAVEPDRQLKIVFEDKDVIREGEFGIPWPRPEFTGAEPGDVIEVHQCYRNMKGSCYADLLKVTPNGDGTVTLTVRNRGVSP